MGKYYGFNGLLMYMADQKNKNGSYFEITDEYVRENPNGWTIQNYGDRGWTWQQAEKNYMPYSGNYSVYMKSAWEDIHQDESLISPVFSNGKTLTFYSKSIAPQKTVKNQFYYVEVSIDGGENWTPVYDLMKDCDVVNDYVKITIDLSDYQSDKMRIAFHAYDTNNIGLSYWWQIDDVSIYSEAEEALVKGFAVYRNGVKVGESESCTYTDLQPLVGENIYTVRAIGDFGETSDSEAVFIVYNPDKISDVITDSDCVKVQIVNNNIELSATMPLRQIALFTMDGTCLSRQNITGKSYKIVVENKNTGIPRCFYLYLIKQPVLTLTGAYFFATLCLNSVLALKDATLRAVMTAGTPVFGFRPIRCGLVKILKLPKPANLTSSPLIKDSRISSKIISINLYASDIVNPCCSRKRFAKSLLVIVAIFYTLIKAAPHVRPLPNAGYSIS